MNISHLKSKIPKSKNQEGDNSQSGPQAGPSNTMVLPLDVDVVVEVNPDPLLSTALGLGSTSESMVPSALSSITTLSTVSNTTATNMEIEERVKGFIQGTLHCQKHVLQWIPYIQVHFQERQKAISLLYKISQVVDTTLIRAYSILIQVGLQREQTWWWEGIVLWSVGATIMH